MMIHIKEKKVLLTSQQVRWSWYHLINIEGEVGHCALNEKANCNVVSKCVELAPPVSLRAARRAIVTRSTDYWGLQKNNFLLSN